MTDLLTKLQELTGTIKDVAYEFGNGGNVLSTNHDRTVRWGICSTCSYHSNGLCNQCGCFLDLKIKLSASKCPEKKW